MTDRDLRYVSIDGLLRCNFVDRCKTNGSAAPEGRAENGLSASYLLLQIGTRSDTGTVDAHTHWQ